MPETPSPIESAPAPNPWRIVAGITVILLWAAVHLILFYLFFASGVVVDVLLAVVRPILFPGLAAFPPGNSEIFRWTGPLQVGLSLAGAAGIPLGLAVFWRTGRKRLLLTFTIAFVTGAGIELYALYLLVSGGFTA